ncbi:MAG TPA: hypothetical protein VIT45_12580 [Allosphingosinicella sp.]
MKPSVLTAIILAALLAGCRGEDGSAGNLVAANASVEEENLERVNYAPGALNAPSAFPPKEAPRLHRFIPVRADRYVEWTYRDHQKPVGYRMGDMTVIVRGPEFPALGYSGSNFAPVYRQVRVNAPGRPEYVHETETGAGLPTLLGFGRFDRAGTPYLVMQTETGGNHCCGVLDLFILRPKRIEYVEIGWFSSDGPPDVRDADGDGLIDFIVPDGIFLNHFTGAASGRAPPKVLNVVGGEVRDVSARPGFRSVFRKAARELRRECLQPGGIDPNSACAAYVAAAGRAGNFKKAWAEMLAAYDKDSKEGLMCRVSLPDESCPSDDLTYATYPEALRAFLGEEGFPTA